MQPGREQDQVPEEIGLPWKPRTRQEQGRQTEKKTLKEHGMKSHPASGAGSIKYDGSNDDVVMEVKDADKSHRLDGKYLEGLYKNAIRQGKDPVMVVNFRGVRLVATITLSRAPLDNT